MAYIRPLEIILNKKTTELVLIFHKKTTKASFSLAQYRPKKHQSVKYKNKQKVSALYLLKVHLDLYWTILGCIIIEKLIHLC